MRREAQDWPAQWLRGALPLCALKVIDDSGPLHGYGISAQLEELGLGDIGGGTLYPLLGRCERDGLVTTAWATGGSGPAKKLYSITPEGKQHLAEAGARWADFAQVTATIISSELRNSDEKQS